MLRYVLITPAKNEAQYIEFTLKSVISQTVLPTAWIIVDDGSEDGTGRIVEKYLKKFEWIDLLRAPARKDRNFSGKVEAFKIGYQRVLRLSFDIVGNLDADVSFDSAYFEFLLGKFAEDPGLGVAGTPFKEGEFQYDYRFTNIDHVSGACQLFRTRCYEDIGGYPSLKTGGVDLVAVTRARMRGWRTRSFPEMHCVHHRVMGSENNRRYLIPFQNGKKDYILGGSPVWEIVRSIYQMRGWPFVISGLMLMMGYLLAAVTGTPKSVDKEFVRFRRKEQMKRLRLFAGNHLPRLSAKAVRHPPQ